MQHAHQLQAVVDREPAAEERRLPTVEEHRPRTLEGTAAGVGRFLLHFLEMWLAMGIGMALFGPVKQALGAQGYAALLDTSSIDFQAWMNLFMIVPMVAWMRVRGHGWRMGAEMSGAMVVPIALVLILCRVGVSDALPWLTPRATGPAMLLGMLAIMLYRREHYTSGYAFLRWRPAWSWAR